MGDVINLSSRCKEHPTYRGDGPPEPNCEKCGVIYIRSIRAKRANRVRTSSSLAAAMERSKKAKEREAEMRKENNRKTKRSYRLDKKEDK